MTDQVTLNVQQRKCLVKFSGYGSHNYAEDWGVGPKPNWLWGGDYQLRTKRTSVWDQLLQLGLLEEVKCGVPRIRLSSLGRLYCCSCDKGQRYIDDQHLEKCEICDGIGVLKQRRG